MLNLKKIISLFLVTAIVSLVGCGENNSTDDKILRIGTIAGPETELMETAKRLAKQRYNLHIKIVQFSDYVLPNIALNDGSIDVNLYQHQPYLDSAMKAHSYDFVTIGKTFIYPMALYSKKIHKLTELKDGAIIAIPNDPSNSARALLLLQKAGLLKLKKDVKESELSVQDVQYNPMGYKIKQLDAAQLPRVLADVDLVSINTNYAVEAGLLPKRDGLYMEQADSPYANIVVVKRKNMNDMRLKMLMDILHSREVVKHARKLFQEQAIAAW